MNIPSSHQLSLLPHSRYKPPIDLDNFVHVWLSCVFVSFHRIHQNDMIPPREHI